MNSPQPHQKKKNSRAFPPECFSFLNYHRRSFTIRNLPNLFVLGAVDAICPCHGTVKGATPEPIVRAASGLAFWVTERFPTSLSRWRAHKVALHGKAQTAPEPQLINPCYGLYFTHSYPCTCYDCIYTHLNCTCNLEKIYFTSISPCICLFLTLSFSFLFFSPSLVLRQINPQTLSYILPTLQDNFMSSLLRCFLPSASVRNLKTNNGTTLHSSVPRRIVYWGFSFFLLIGEFQVKQFSWVCFWDLHDSIVFLSKSMRRLTANTTRVANMWFSSFMSWHSTVSFSCPLFSWLKPRREMTLGFDFFWAEDLIFYIGIHQIVCNLKYVDPSFYNFHNLLVLIQQWRFISDGLQWLYFRYS